LVRNLAPLFDLYVNDAFAAAHRASPSMIAFQELLPSAAGKLLLDEINALTKVVQKPARPCVFVLGGLRIADAFGMMRQALSSGTADFILTGGVTGQVMLMARGVSLGEQSENFIKERSLDRFIDDAKEYLARYTKKIVLPDDVATAEGGKRQEFPLSKLPIPGLITDIGAKTIASFGDIIKRAGTIFVNGPPGVYEEEASSNGTEALWKLISSASGYSVIGGGDTISSASRFIDTSAINYVCTAGGALIRFLSGVEGARLQPL
jgi:phosphoglycerate kinase